ncbi:hypothetical protein [Acinetobacter tandoii]|jgi:hypothetical protein|uniref:Uncharacterized protein n=1 Tax=Acinetobacter tandoii DSM 14970 = CIP 107469 TaxID=1120927 RepID=R9B4E6_9GAMM|nr:hypothetical protein [Acinetobacter tandoii]EOR09292.1 hypothetical protein I593_01000 [Acinetobacter tandoii DSM 14970 = CIP 107469]
MNKLLISFFLISGAFIAQHVFADTELFKVYKQCHDEMEFRCDVIREVNGEKNIIYKEMKSPVIKRLNDEYYHVKISCGSPCQGHAFIARSKQKDDATSEFITINAKNNCLIETDSARNKIIARQLNSKKSYTLISTKNHIFQNVPIFDIAQYTVFQGSSYFDQNGNLILVADEIDDQKKFKKIFPNPCKL